MTQEIQHSNKYKIPSQKLFSKLEIIREFKNIEYENYWCVFDSNSYVAILSNKKLVAKQYPGKKLYYKC